MKKTTQLKIMYAMMVGFVALVVFLYPSLPAQLPMQWGLDGKVNYSLPKLPVVIGMVVANLGYNVYSARMHRNEERIPWRDFMTSFIIFGVFTVILAMTLIRF